MKKRTDGKLNIVAPLFKAILCLIATVSVSFAWFSGNKSVRANGISVSAADGAEILRYEFYAADGTSDAYDFKIVDAGSARLGTYDLLDDKYQLLLIIYLKSDVESAYLTAETSTDYFLGDGNHPLLKARDDDPHLPDDDGKGYTNALSSVVSFVALDRSELTETEYGYALSALPDPSRTSGFVDAGASPVVVGNSARIKKTESENAVPVYRQSTGEGTVYILISYDTLLVSTVFSANIGNADIYSGGGEMTDIPFRSDFSITVGKAD